MKYLFYGVMVIGAIIGYFPKIFVKNPSQKVFLTIKGFGLVIVLIGLLLLLYCK